MKQRTDWGEDCKGLSTFMKMESKVEEREQGSSRRGCCHWMWTPRVQEANILAGRQFQHALTSR